MTGHNRTVGVRALCVDGECGHDTCMMEQIEEARHDMARALMRTRPDLAYGVSLDEWYLQHSDSLSDSEKAAAEATLNLINGV